MKYAMKVIIGLSIIFSGMILFVSCQGPAEIETPTQTEVPTEVIEQVATEIESVEEPTEVPPLPTPEMVDNCLVCHLDKQRLIFTAKPEVELESENDGEG